MDINKIVDTYAILLVSATYAKNIEQGKVIANKMLNSVKNCALNHNHKKSFCAWFTHNPTLAKASKANGIKTLAELRQVLTQ
jgi:hypothetical protein